MRRANRPWKPVPMEVRKYEPSRSGALRRVAIWPMVYVDLLTKAIVSDAVFDDPGDGFVGPGATKRRGHVMVFFDDGEHGREIWMAVTLHEEMEELVNALSRA